MISAPEVFVARQPILDRLQRAHAYQLPFRSSRENAFDGSHPDQASLKLQAAEGGHLDGVHPTLSHH